MKFAVAAWFPLPVARLGPRCDPRRRGPKTRSRVSETKGGQRTISFWNLAHVFGDQEGEEPLSKIGPS